MRAWHCCAVSTLNGFEVQTPDPFTCAFVHNPSNPDEYLVKYNPMATLINPLGEDTISRLFARGVHREFGYTTLWVLLGWCGPSACAAGSVVRGPDGPCTRLFLQRRNAHKPPIHTSSEVMFNSDATVSRTSGFSSVRPTPPHLCMPFPA